MSHTLFTFCKIIGRGSHLLLYLCLYLYLSSTTQSQIIRWQKNGSPVNRSAGLQRTPKITTDGGEGAIIAWENYQSPSGDIYAQRLNLWSLPQWDTAGVVVCRAPDAQRLDGIVSDGAGGAIIVWSDKRNGTDYDIYAQHLDKDGNALWNKDGKVICSAAMDQFQSQIIPDQEGGAIIVWQDKRSGTVTKLYAQHISIDGRILWTANGIPCCYANGDQLLQEIIPDNQNGIILTWVDKRSVEDIYAQRLNANGNILWDSVGVLVCGANRIQTTPRIASDGQRGAYIAWLDFRTSDTAEVYIQRLDVNGNRVLNPASGLLMTTNLPNNISKTNLEISEDGLDGAIVVWTGYPGGSSTANIYGRRIDKTGTLRWSAGGTIINNQTDTQELPRLISDQAGGALVVWQDKRNALNYDLYMQRVDASGSLKWNSAGVPVVQYEQDQVGAEIIAGGSGKAIITWRDGRVQNGNADIYAHWIGYAPILPLPDSIVFKNTRVGFDDIKKLTLKNAGADTLVITSLTSAGDFFLIGPPGIPHRISPGDSTSITINFRPIATGRRTANLTITSNASPSPQIVLLSGRGELPDLGTMPTTINLGRVKVGKTKDTLLTNLLKNTGTGNLTITSLLIAGRNADQFSLVNPPTIPFTIAEGQSTSVTLRAVPTFAAVTTASLIIVSDGATSNRVITLTDTSAYPVAKFANQNNFLADSIRFPLTDFAKQSIRTFIVRDSVVAGVPPLPLDVYRTEIRGRDSLDFKVISTSKTLPAVLVPNEALTITIAFSPVGGGLRYSDLRIYCDILTSPKSIALYGLSSIPVGVASVPQAKDFLLEQNYPNPFSESTTIRYSIVVKDLPWQDFRLSNEEQLGINNSKFENLNSQISFTVYDVLGRQVLDLSSNLRSQLGNQDSAIEIRASQFPTPGMYFYRLSTPTFSETRAMVMVR